MSSDSLIGMWTLSRREVVRILRVWTQTVVPPVITSTLFILIFGLSLGSRIDSIGGVSYLDFIIPGLLMMATIQSAYGNSSMSLYLSKFQGNVQEWLVAPITYWQIISALTIAATVRSLLVGAGILIIIAVLTDITIASWPALLFFFFGTVFIFCFAGIATALWAKSFDQVSVFSIFLITPLTYLGGVFYSLEMLPPFWQNVAKVNPILYMVDGFRFSFLGFSDIPILYSGLLVGSMALVFFLLCVQMFRKGYNLRS